MPFSWVSGDSGAKLRELRFQVLDTISLLVVSHQADFVVIAGDLFDANTLPDRIIHQACVRMSRIPVPVYLLPGNHDHTGVPNAILQRPSFREACPDNVVVMDRCLPYEVLDGRAVLLPAPITRRVPEGDPTDHLNASFGRELAPNAIRIGVAHGSVRNFAGTEMAVIAADRAETADLDYLALGDWHGLKEIDARTWYSGTPEPTAFRDNRPGELLLVEVERHGGPTVVTPIRSAQTTWLSHSATLMSDQSIDALVAWFEQLPDRLATLLRLELTGSLCLEDHARLTAVTDRMAGELLVFRLEKNIRVQPVDSELHDLAEDGFVKRTVERLITMIDADNEQSDTARHALQLLHHLHQGGGS